MLRRGSRKKMIPQYIALCVSTTVWTPQKREDIMRYNVRRIARQIRASMWGAALGFPIKLIALPELAITGAPDEIRLLDHEQMMDIVIDIPGEETEALGQICKKHGVYLIGQAKAKDPEIMPDRFFNTCFIISPEGKVIHKHHKTHVGAVEPSLVPGDVWDIYVEKYGNDPKKLLEAIFPVARTEIGNIGTIICAEGFFPESSRALAMKISSSWISSKGRFDDKSAVRLWI